MIAAIAGGVFTAITAGLLVWAHTRKIRIPRDGRWARPPSVLLHVLCDGVTLEDVEDAASYWRALLEPMGPVRAYGGTTRAVSGAIVIIPGTADDLAGNRIATCQKVRMDDEIVAGIIRVGDLSTRDAALVIAHELGHAIGLEHVPNAPNGHIMATKYTRVGWDATGL